MLALATLGDNSAGFGVLVRLKLTILRNLLVGALANSPVKLATGAAFLILIWFGLYGLFYAVFHQFEKTPLEQAVVVPMVFNIFFLTLLALLAFSNAVLAYGSLFGGRESGFLLSAPVRPSHVVLIKYIESLFFTSWSLILLGLPLMMAMAHNEEESWIFYPLFVAFFLFFVPIPGALGLLLAWLAARVTRAGGRRVLGVVGGITLAAAALWCVRMVHDAEMINEHWANVFFARMEFVETAVLPSTWVARGVESALHDHPGEAVGYLAVTLSNALFVSLLAVQVCARGLLGAVNRVGANAGRVVRLPRRAGGNGVGLCDRVFFYLPVRLRLIAAKDLRTFLRDPLQWSQLAILFGLMALYLLNLPRSYVAMFESTWGVLVPFLNLCAVTLILATFTSRFVFPLISLEGDQLWLIGLLPLPRGRVLSAKFAYALTVTTAAALFATTLAAVSLELQPVWAAIHVGVTLSVCVGLCGLAVGLGARMPMFGQASPGRIANGFGGTVNLISSVALVAVVLAGMGWVAWRCQQLGLTAGPDLSGWLIVGSVAVIAIATGLIALHLGARHFQRLEM
ncbi:MAG: hypothetical protein GY778_04460 [bacterium]|nr:hypothetical protein [bacterium]